MIMWYLTHARRHPSSEATWAAWLILVGGGGGGGERWRGRCGIQVAKLFMARTGAPAKNTATGASDVMVKSIFYAFVCGRK